MSKGNKNKNNDQNGNLRDSQILMALEDFRSDFATVLEHQSAQIANLDEKFTKRFDEIDKRFEAIDKRFEAIDKRFEEIDKKFEINFEYLSKIDDEIVEIRKELRLLRKKDGVQDKKIKNVERKLVVLENKYNEMTAKKLAENY